MFKKMKINFLLSINPRLSMLGRRILLFLCKWLVSGFVFDKNDSEVTVTDITPNVQHILI